MKLERFGRITLLPGRVETGNAPWCREARLLHIDGAGALRWEVEEDAEASWKKLSWLTLRGTPLAFVQSSGCPTCESLLAAGWGRDRADWPELAAVRRVLNEGFTRLEDAVSDLEPLLALLPAGLYVLADGWTVPAEGSGEFFWDVPDALTPYAATASIELCDDDFSFEWPDCAPIFLYPTQPRSALDEGRVDFFRERYESGDAPRALALSLGEGMSVLLDGHHKAAAAARLGRRVPTLTLLPLIGYGYLRTGILGRRLEIDRAFFSPLSVPTAGIPQRYLPDRETLFRRITAPPPAYPGHLADREIPAAYRRAARRYLTAQEAAVVSAAGIGFPSDRELEAWLADPSLHRRQLRAALALLRSAGDPRLKPAALRCGAIPARDCSLREEAFRMLAAMRGDPEAEEFFIRYFVDLDEDHGDELLTKIAHSFWEPEEA